MGKCLSSGNRIVARIVARIVEVKTQPKFIHNTSHDSSHNSNLYLRQIHSALRPWVAAENAPQGFKRADDKPMFLVGKLGVLGTAGRVFAVAAGEQPFHEMAMVGREGFLVQPNQADGEAARKSPKFTIYNFQFTNKFLNSNTQFPINTFRPINTLKIETLNIEYSL